MKKFQLKSDILFSPLNKKQWDIVQQLITDLSVSQVIWLSGYLCGLSVNSDTNFFCNDVIVSSGQEISCSESVVSCSYITILSASQTGNAKKLAEELYQSLIERKFNVRLFNVADYNIKKISQEKLFFLIISTYGEGEPPEEAVILHKYLFSNNPPNMKGVCFSVFGLGDRSYTYFSKAAKDFDKRLEELGASRIYERIDADVDYFQQASDWRGKIITLLEQQKFAHFNKGSSTIFNSSQSVVNNVINKDSMVYTKESPFFGNLMVRQKITSRNSSKAVYHLEINLSGSGIRYQPGDALGIWYENDPMLVNELLEYCNFTGDEKVSIGDKLLPCNVALQKYYELTRNTLWFARSYADLIHNKELSLLVSDEAHLKNFITSTSIIDMIRLWPPKGLLPKEILSLFRPLTPRFYSIASSQDEVGEEVHITVGVVRYKIDNFIRSGGASGYLVDRISEGDKLPVFVVSNNNFRLPLDYNTSVIMVSAGTGIAPFRAFIQQRSLHSMSGKNWLFFGNLNFIDDFLYQREWQKYVKDGILTSVNTAWSRDQNHKIYVQDKILEYGSEIWRWIEDGAYIYICGDASRMARGVEKSLIQLAVEYGKMSFEESALYWENMRASHRYQKDIY